MTSAQFVLQAFTVRRLCRSQVSAGNVSTLLARRYTQTEVVARLVQAAACEVHLLIELNLPQLACHFSPQQRAAVNKHWTGQEVSCHCHQPQQLLNFSSSLFSIVEHSKNTGRTQSAACLQPEATYINRCLQIPSLPLNTSHTRQN